MLYKWREHTHEINVEFNNFMQFIGAELHAY